MIDDDDEVVEIKVVIERETQMAFLVNDGDEDIWIPKSQVKNSKTHRTGNDYCKMTISLWIAEQKGLA